MTAIRFFNWFLSAVFGFVCVELLQMLIGKVLKDRFWILLLIVKFLLMTALALLLIAMASPFLWKTNYPLSGLYIALLASCFSDVVFHLISMVYKNDLPLIRKVIALAMMAVFLVYGTVNMQMIRPNRLQYTSDKISRKYTIVFLADLHYGSSQSRKTVEKAMAEIRNLNADLVLLGGDITDENTSKEDMQLVYEMLGNLDTQVYFIYGNHDRQDRGGYLGGSKYSEKELEDAILKNGIMILKDEHFSFDDDLVIIGREDPSRTSRLPVDKLEPWPKDSYVISVEHNPYLNDDILATGADLQLSGHTHAGQYFPLKTVYALAGLNVYGNYKIGVTDVYVSSGISGWRMPFRNEANCNYEVIELLPAGK